MKLYAGRYRALFDSINAATLDLPPVEASTTVAADHHPEPPQWPDLDIDDSRKNLLGSGAFGEVYRVYSRALETDVAMKCVALRSPQQDCARVEREADACGSNAPLDVGADVIEDLLRVRLARAEALIVPDPVMTAINLLVCGAFTEAKSSPSDRGEVATVIVRPMLAAHLLLTMEPDCHTAAAACVAACLQFAGQPLARHAPTGGWI